MTISREIREAAEMLEPKLEEFLKYWRIAVAALVIEAVCVIVILILCAVIAHRGGR